MSYIKREILLAEIMDCKIACVRKDSQIALESFERMVKWQPTADVVEVVRCRDCKHFTEEMIGDDLEGFCKCVSGMLNPAPDFYCSYGERRDNEENY